MVMIKRVLKDKILWVINRLIKTDKCSIFSLALENAAKDHYDILNCNSSNMLKLLRYICETKHKNKITIYLSYYDDERLPEYYRFANDCKKNNVNLVFYREIRSGLSIKNILSRIKIDILRFKSGIWMNESGGTFFAGKNKNQCIICLNYFISCKEDYQVGKERKWEFLDYLTTTALLPTQIICAANGVLFGNCHLTGFPRNDTFFGKERMNVVYSWIEKKIGYIPKRIFVYAPTYRDYENGINSSRPLFGYNTNGLAQLLNDNSAVLIYKLHPYQNDIIIDGDNMIMYEATYDFSLYDLLSISDCLICDYSSLSYDYLLLNKPIIFNLYDLDLYSSIRGLSYQPYEKFCYGEIVKNRDELFEAIIKVIKNNDNYKYVRENNVCLFHKNIDGNSTKRAYDDVNRFIGNVL